ncbi:MULTISPECIES: DNA polymerase III subunit psi [unclassified Psychrobacter]|uniref:DNA polymerase III subunit psi n=1 Tax=unclassified Psychrobacter TaxID=196806 RepID=UPI0025B604E0|nr:MULTISPECIES: DNA polymerase III subunit psi [unclassified Psychrobacter]MDN3451919.1 DNA polymerase III subunit psi [Psychrobacter sp. APC 3350]MDN3501857.1 DNA polymerase III subunit psi [Psychrobacter sp. 5A.1]
MSDTQDPLIVLQRRVQQRQILAMMGINQWVQPASQTINMADIATVSVKPSNTDSTDIRPTNHESTSAEFADIADQPISDYDVNDYNTSDYAVDEYDTDSQAIGEQTANEQSPVTYSFDSVDSNTVSSSAGSNYHDIPSTVSNQTVATSTNAPVEQHSFAQSNFPKSTSDNSINDDSLKKVVPFDLQGGRYGDWVILVDIQALNSDSQKLWQNITQALSISCETTSFPICNGMDTAELANASLAGYIFRIGRSEEIQVAALTALPDGLQHPNLTTVPTLEEMLVDSDAKRQLWEQISH